jgi:hypothetical protein
MEVNPDTSKETLTMYDYINNFFMTPVVFIIVFVIIIAYFILFSSLGKKTTELSSSATATFGSNLFSSVKSPVFSSEETSGKGFKVLMMIGVIIFIVVILMNIFKWLKQRGFPNIFNYDIVASTQNLLKGQPEIDIKATEIQSSPIIAPLAARKQVFNIPGNTYGYNDAAALCSAYGSRLATYSEIEEAYNEGAEWCNYGWSEGQNAFYPTQKDTFNKLQTIQGHEHDCGRPGINGGYIANPRVQFGANCYGYKPHITTEEDELMKVATAYPKTQKDVLIEKRVNYWKQKLDEILVSPFNYDTWSKI